MSVNKGHARAWNTYLEGEILLKLAELFDLGFDLRLGPVLDQLLRRERDLLALAFVFILHLGGFGQRRQRAREALLQLDQARLYALEGALRVMDGIREPTRGEVERDAQLVMRLGELARRQREQLRF